MSFRRLAMAIGMAGAALGWAARAQGGIALRMDAVVGTPDVVLTWAVDAVAPAPYVLLRRVVPAGAFVSDALPLDPVADAWMSGLSGPTLALPAEAGPGPESVTVYQLVDGAGGCSNAGYVVRTAVQPIVGQWYSVQHTAGLAFPPWPGIRTAFDLFRQWPDLVQLRWYDESRCLRRDILRWADGSITGHDTLLAGRTIEIRVSRATGFVLVGASDAADPALFDLPFPAGCGASRSPQHRIASSPATRWRHVDELLCGVEGLDWVDADRDGLPDTCTAGAYDSVHGVSLAIFDGAPATNGFIPRGVAPGFAGRTSWSGTRWAVAPALGWYESLTNGMPTRPIAGRDAGASPACRCPDGDGDGRDDCTELLEGTDPFDATSFGPDEDRDGVPDRGDACPATVDPLQENADGDARGDACDPCPLDAADACDDPDADGLFGTDDNCPLVANLDQDNRDGDRLGDACDSCPDVGDDQADLDADGRGDACDICPSAADPGQENLDGDAFGDACDHCPATSSPRNLDSDRDGEGDACDCYRYDGWRTGPEVLDLRVSREGAGIRLRWSPDPAFPSTVTFDVVRGPLAGIVVPLIVGAECAMADSPATTLSEPMPAQDEWWLVRERAPACRGTFGRSNRPELINVRAGLGLGLAGCP